MNETAVYMYRATKYTSRRLARLVISRAFASAAIGAVSLLPLPGSAAAVNLATYNVDINDTSVSGLSSGAYMAVQMQIAFSSIMKGAGIIAGGPYNCGSQNPFAICMFLNSPNVTPLIAETRSRSGSSIDDVSNLANHKVFMFSGGNDFTVSRTVMDKLYQYYTTAPALVPAANILYVNNHRPAPGHTFPTNFFSPGNEACTSFTGFPWISNCNYDAAGTLLRHIYGPLNPRNNGALGGEFVEFNQAEFMPAGVDPRTKGMDDSGWMYVPANCKPVSEGGPGQACKLHVAFHGCHQFFEHSDLLEGAFRDKFIRNTGYNRWADRNNIIVLYPQTVKDTVNHNPPSGAGANENGCWDWVGYYGTNFDTRNGVQLAAIKKMIDRITGNENGNGAAGPINPSVAATTSKSVLLSGRASAGLMVAADSGFFWKHIDTNSQ
jgi:poly(3-hydroxybutyrate) depolymerase